MFRKIEAEDFKRCLEFFLDPRANRYWNNALSDPHALAQEWFDKQMWRYENNKGGMNLLIHQATGEPIGWCGLLVQVVDEVEEIEVGYSIIPRHWGNGYATEAAVKCKVFAFEHKLARSLISIIHINNVESKRVAIKNGMVREKNTIYHDNPVEIFRVFRPPTN